MIDNSGLLILSDDSHLLFKCMHSSSIKNKIDLNGLNVSVDKIIDDNIRYLIKKHGRQLNDLMLYYEEVKSDSKISSGYILVREGYVVDISKVLK